VGEYLLLLPSTGAGPGQQTQARRWYRNTNFGPAPSAALSRLAQSAFLDHMNYLDESTLQRIENDITRRLVEEWKVNLTNAVLRHHQLDTFLSSETRRLAQRGHAKSKRTDLRHRGPGAAGLWDFHIPLFSQIYEGNQNDSVPFSRFWTI